MKTGLEKEFGMAINNKLNSTNNARVAAVKQKKY